MERHVWTLLVLLVAARERAEIYGGQVHYKNE